MVLLPSLFKDTFFVYLVLRSISTNSDLVFLIGNIGPKISTKCWTTITVLFIPLIYIEWGFYKFLLQSRVFKNAVGFQYPSGLYTSQKASHLPR